MVAASTASDQLLPRLRTALRAQYVVERELGRGGMACVFLAQDLRHHRAVAIKVLHPELASSVGAERFLREIRTVAHLVHPHILPLYDSGQADGLLYYIMPCLRGESLADRLERERRLPIAEAVRVARELADALAHAHASGVVHRDIKPSNVLLSGGEHACLADFGLATVLTTATNARLTETGMMVGSPLYMSPEQIDGGRPVDGRADVYGLGCVLFEMLSGQPPFNGPTSQSVLLRHLTQSPPSVRALRPEVPDELAKALARTLEKDPARRLDAAGMLTVLDALSRSPEQLSVALPDQVASVAPRVLVLPFAEYPADADSDRIGVALTDEIITNLSGLDALRVIARSSALQLQGTTKDMRRLGRELDVQFVVEGSVQRQGDRLRIPARIARVEDEQIVWARVFTGSTADLFGVEETIARAVAEALSVRLSPSEDRRLAKRSIPDVRAYEYFLRAKQQVFMFTGEALDRALAYLNKGAALLGQENDQILAAMGYVYWQYYNAGIRPDPANLEKARECGERLLARDPESPDGHRLVGLVTTQLSGDSRAAIAHLQRALQSNPYDTDTMLWLGVLYGFVGRSSSGGPLVERLLEIDPLTSLHHVLPGVLALLDGDFSRAIPLLRTAQQLDEQNPIATLFYAQALAMTGQSGDSSAVFARLERNLPDTFFAALARVYRAALSGDPTLTRQAITGEVVEVSRADFQYSWNLAQALAMVGATGESLRWLENAVRQGLINFPLIAERDPLLAPVRREPAFGGLLAEVREQWLSLDR